MTTQNFPPPNLPVVDSQGRLNQVWMRFFLSLFDRTGGAIASPSAFDTVQAFTTTPIPDARVDVLFTAMFAAMRGELDALRKETERLRAEVESARKPDMEPLRAEVARLWHYIGELRRNAPQLPSTGEIYAFMRR